MTKSQFQSLSVGDLIRPLAPTAEGTIITAQKGDRVITARSQEISVENCDEWEIVKKASYKSEV